MLIMLILSEQCPTLVSHSVYLNNIANVEIQRSMRQNCIICLKNFRVHQIADCILTMQKKSIYPLRSLSYWNNLSKRVISNFVKISFVWSLYFIIWDFSNVSCICDTVWILCVCTRTWNVLFRGVGTWNFSHCLHNIFQEVHLSI